MATQGTRSDPPDRFHDDREKSYWHMAQDIAFRAGFRLEELGGIVYSISETAEEQICRPSRPKRCWCETWLVLHERFQIFLDCGPDIVHDATRTI